jgi:hypothetical protein
MYQAASTGVQTAQAAADTESKLARLDSSLGELCGRIRERFANRPFQQNANSAEKEAAEISEKLEDGWRKMVSMKVLIKQLDPDGGGALAWQRRHKHIARLLDRLASEHANSLEIGKHATRPILPGSPEKSRICSFINVAAEIHTVPTLSGDDAQQMQGHGGAPRPWDQHGQHEAFQERKGTNKAPDNAHDDLRSPTTR